MSIAAVAPFVGAHPPFFPFFFLVPVVWILVIGAIVFFVARSRRRWWSAYGPASNRSAEQTLAERFAQGDIEEQEYRARLEVLRANRVALR